jgi:DAPG hydrolase PhiG domain
MRDAPNLGDRWVGTTGIIDEWVGPGEMLKIAITFEDAGVIGLTREECDKTGLFVVAHVTDRDSGRSFVDRNVCVAYPTPGGVHLKLRFWMNKEVDEAAARKVFCPPTGEPHCLAAERAQPTHRIETQASRTGGVGRVPMYRHG